MERTVAFNVLQETGLTHKVCDGSGEDNSCADSVSFPIDVDDHLSYLDIPMGSAHC